MAAKQCYSSLCCREVAQRDSYGNSTLLTLRRDFEECEPLAALGSPLPSTSFAHVYHLSPLSLAAPSHQSFPTPPNMLSLAVLALAVASPAVAQLSVMRATSELPSNRRVSYATQADVPCPPSSRLLLIIIARLPQRSHRPLASHSRQFPELSTSVRPPTSSSSKLEETDLSTCSSCPAPACPTRSGVERPPSRKLPPTIPFRSSKVSTRPTTIRSTLSCRSLRVPSSR